MVPRPFGETGSGYRHHPRGGLGSVSRRGRAGWARVRRWGTWPG
ncbi:hypothetical protein ACFPM0_28160 [Pseudonocardia sulfidoxydans]